jgi:hypothetical protein
MNIHGNIKFPVTDMTSFDKELLTDLKKSKLEVALDNCNHTMELVRTIIPILILIIQIIILFKI